MGVNVFKRLGLVVIVLSHVCMASMLPSAPYSQTLLAQDRAFASFDAPPKTLDPAKAYNAPDLRFIEQIYEPLYTYDYYKRPYTLVPFAAASMPRVTYIDQNGKMLTKRPADVTSIAKSVYHIPLREDLFYFPSKHLPPQKEANAAYAFKVPYRLAIRRATALDFVYQIKRMADPTTGSPINGLLAKKIEGFADFSQQALAHPKRPLSDSTLSGVTAEEPFVLQITTIGYQPQFLYWLATAFFSPMPTEVETIRQLRLDWQTFGTGTYGFSQHQPYYRMQFEPNPYYRLVLDKGHALPKIPRVLFTLEKESIPRWHKFMHGFYDQSGIGSDQFAQVLKQGKEGKLELTDAIKAKGIQLAINQRPSISYWVFNQEDPIVGGTGPKAKALREAIALAFDWDEYIAIFLNGRGTRLQGPIPPGIEGFEPYQVDALSATKRLAKAQKLLQTAGYPGGIDPKTGKPLLLHFLTEGSGSPEEQTVLQWYREQFAKLGIVLNIEVLPFARFLDRLHKGQMQMTMSGWMADYPDPENLLFLFTTEQKVHGGEGQNIANYQNPAFDACYQKVRYMDPGPHRAKTVTECVALINEDKPVLFVLAPQAYVLSHAWVKDYTPSGMTLNPLKYARREHAQRQASQQAWNQPKWWVLWALGGGFLMLLAAIACFVHKRQLSPGVKRSRRGGDE